LIRFASSFKRSDIDTKKKLNARFRPNILDKPAISSLVPIKQQELVINKLVTNPDQPYKMKVNPSLDMSSREEAVEQSQAFPEIAVDFRTSEGKGQVPTSPTKTITLNPTKSSLKSKQASFAFRSQCLVDQMAAVEVSLSKQAMALVDSPQKQTSLSKSSKPRLKRLDRSFDWSRISKPAFTGGNPEISIPPVHEALRTEQPRIKIRISPKLEQSLENRNPRSPKSQTSETRSYSIPSKTSKNLDTLANSRQGNPLGSPQSRSRRSRYSISPVQKTKNSAVVNCSIELDQDAKQIVFLPEQGKYADHAHILDTEELIKLARLTKTTSRQSRLAADRSVPKTVYMNTLNY
jgi:hypothetical protein